jgi:hypothetical protein
LPSPRVACLPQAAMATTTTKNIAQRPISNLPCSAIQSTIMTQVSQINNARLPKAAGHVEEGRRRITMKN